MRHEMDFGAARREMSGERMIGDVHSSERRQVAGHDEPGSHERRIR